MTKRELERRVRVWQSRLALNHWDLAINFEQGTDEATTFAEIGKPYDHDNATLYFNAAWRSWTPEEATSEGLGQNRPVDEIIVHELLHLTTRELDFAVDKLLDGHLPRSSEDLVSRSFNHALEGVVDRVARVIIAGFPPP